MPVESFSLRRDEESLHAQRMITQSRQFCLSGDVTPPTFNPLQKAYVVFRVMGAGGCEESQRERERESSRERELGDRLSFGVYLAVYLLCGQLARISSPHEIGNWPPGQRALLSTDCCAKDRRAATRTQFRIFVELMEHTYMHARTQRLHTHFRAHPLVDRPHDRIDRFFSSNQSSHTERNQERLIVYMMACRGCSLFRAREVDSDLQETLGLGREARLNSRDPTASLCIT